MTLALCLTALCCAMRTLCRNRRDAEADAMRYETADGAEAADVSEAVDGAEAALQCACLLIENFGL